jgi:hypothetical protein
MKHERQHSVNFFNKCRPYVRSVVHQNTLHGYYVKCIVNAEAKGTICIAAGVSLHERLDI